MGDAPVVPSASLTGAARKVGRIVAQDFIPRVVEASAHDGLAAASRTLLEAAAGVVHAAGGSAAVPTGEIGEPAPGLARPLVTPADRLIDRISDRDRIGAAADLVPHFPIAVRAHGHVRFSLLAPGDQGRAGL
jgi:hypothetical protein